jgi:hypothetical protein
MPEKTHGNSCGLSRPLTKTDSRYPRYTHGGYKFPLKYCRLFLEQYQDRYTHGAHSSFMLKFSGEVTAT